MWGLYVLSGELGESQALLTRWYIAGGHVGVPEVVVFVIVAKYTSRTAFYITTEPFVWGLEMGNVAELHRSIPLFVTCLICLHQRSRTMSLLVFY